MKIVLETYRDDQTGCGVFFYGDVDQKGLHSFCGTADDLETAWDMAKECIRTETEILNAPIT